jgi:hypothetical protein
MEEEASKRIFRNKNMKPLEEYARNYDNIGEFECPISQETCGVDDAIMLTCCRNLVSSQSFTLLKQHRTTECPLCRRMMITSYIYVKMIYSNNYILLGCNLGKETVDGILLLINDIYNKSHTKLYYHGRRLYPGVNTLASFNVQNGHGLTIM